ncbi:MAG: chemotaxis protein CheX [Bacteriovoracaceae bacterium]|nr:chemotaxis protein CheX [Bacteriovoracaceae bacterium]
MTDYLSHRFKDNNLKIDHSADGTQALVKLVQDHYDLMITDIKMPKMDGHQLMEAVQELPKINQPDYVVVASGHDVFDANKMNGQVVFMEKPVELQTLAKYVGATLTHEINQTITAEIANPFIDGTLMVMDKLCTTPTKKQETYVRKEGQVKGDISGVIQLLSPHLEGSMSISFEEECFLGAVGRMFGEKIEKIDEGTMDAVGEISNQIYGYAKTELNKKGFAFGLALPTVVTGSQHSLKHTVPGLCFSTRFETPEGGFVLEVVLRSTENK